MTEWHALLKRQAKKEGFSLESLDETTEKLLLRVNKSYFDMDQERYTTERSYEIASNEMQTLRDHLEK